MRREPIRRWVENQRAAEQRIQEEERAAPINPAHSVRAALDLVDLYASLHGWPPRETKEDRHEDLRAYEAWARLRAHYRRR